METLKDMLSAAWSQFDSQVFGVIPEDDASSLESIDALSTVEPARTCEDDQKVQTGEEACSLVPTAVLEEDSRHLPPDTENSVASEPTIIHIGNQNIQPEDEIYTEACTEFDGQVCARVHVTVLQEDSTPDSYNLTASEPVSTCTEDQKMQDEKEIYTETCSEVESDVSSVMPEEDNRFSSLDSEYLSASEPIAACAEDLKMEDEEENIGTEIYSEVHSQVPTTVPEEDSRHSLPDYCSEVDSQVPTTVPEEDSRHSLPDYCSEVDSQVLTTVPEEDSRHSLPDYCSEVDSQVPTVMPEEDSRHSLPDYCSEVDSQVPTTVPEEDSRHSLPDYCSEVDSQVPTTVPEEDSRHSLPDYCSEVDSQVPTTVPEEDSRHSLPDYCSEVDSQVPTTVPEEDSRHSLPDYCSEVDSQVPTTVPEEDSRHSLPDYCSEVDSQVPTTVPEEDSRHSLPDYCSEVDSQVPTTVPEEDSRHSLPDYCTEVDSQVPTTVPEEDSRHSLPDYCSEVDSQVPTTVPEEDSRHSLPDYCTEVDSQVPTTVPEEDSRHSLPDYCSEVDSQVPTVMPEEDSRHSLPDYCSEVDSQVPTTVPEEDSRHSLPDYCSEVDSQVPTVMPEEDSRHSLPDYCTEVDSQVPTTVPEEDSRHSLPDYCSEVDSQVPTTVPEEDSRHSLPDYCTEVDSQVPTTVPEEDSRHSLPDYCSEVDSQVPTTVPEEDSRHSLPDYCSEVDSQVPTTVPEEDSRHSLPDYCSEVDSQVPTTVPEEDSRHSLPDYCSEVDSQVPTTVPEEDSRHSLPDYCSEVDSQVPTTVPEDDCRHSLPDSENLTGSEPITACREDMEEEGRRVYEREFLVNLRYTPESMKFPQNVPILNCFKGPKNLPKKEKKKKSKKSEVTPPSEVDILQLNWTDNPWKPRFMQILCTNDQAEEGDVQETYRKVRGVLNKVTAQKFTTFMAVMSTLSIDGMEEMENLVNLIYKRAVDEPLYCRVYAQMCKVLSVLLIPAQRRHRGANFCQLLLNRCQIEFQKDPKVEIRREDWFTQIKAALDPWEREELKFNFDEEERRIRMRFVGNVRFMAEIFKLEMIAIATMHCCIMYLIQAGDEISLECLCVLLTHAGRYMESKHEDLSLYFALMKSICEIRVSNRLRFMLMDVTELRQNKWKPRNNAKLMLQEFTLQPSKARQRKIKKATLERDILQRPSDTGSITESDNLDSSSVQSECVRNSMTVQSDSVLVSEDKQIQNVGLAHEEELYKIVHDVLNKQTADKFTELVGLLTEHNRRNLTQLQGIVIIIYEKAMEEPNFSVAYAQLCRTLSEMEVTLEKEYEHLIQTVNFKKLLVEHCESEFRKNSEVKLMRESRMKEIEEISDMAVVKKLLCDLEEEDHIRQIKFQSHVRFIGDLYKVGMLTKKIVRLYIYRLLKEENEESLECLSVLFTTAGKDMESDNMDLSKYFTKIKEICDASSELPERIRFMLHDLIKLRQSWVPQSNLNLEPSVVEQEKVLNPEPLLVEQDKSLNLEPSAVEQEKVLDQQSLLSALGTSDQQDGDAPLGQEGCSSMPSGENREVGGASVTAQEEEKLDPVKVNNDKVLQKLHKMANKLDLAVPDRLDKFTELATQIEVLPVRNTHELQLLVDLIHEKALNEPAYYNQYTKISKVLSEMIVPRDKRRKNEAKHVTFAELLRKRCELELEKVSHIELNRTERLREIEAIADMNNKRELQLRLEKETQMLRMRAVANIRFIGELYKYGIINVKTLHENIGDLLNGYDEISLECLCVLFTSVGRRLKVMNQDVTGYFIALQKISWYQGLSNHIKCMLQELIELWRNDWVPQGSSGQTQKVPRELTVEEQLLPSVGVNVPQLQDLTKSENNPQSTDRTHSELTATPPQLITQTEDEGAASLLVLQERTPEKMKVMRNNNKKVLQKLHKTAFKTVPNVVFRLATHIETIPLNNSDELQSIVNLICEVAMNEPEFSPQCAKLSKALAELQVPRESTSGELEFVNFKQLLVKQCKSEVEKVCKVQVKREATGNLEMKKELQLELEDEEQKLRLRAIGIIRFVSELFKQWVLNIGNIYGIIKCLINKHDNESLRCLCMLFTAVGKQMEAAPGVDLSKNFAKLKNVSCQPGISNELKLIVQELIELRENGWISQSKSSPNQSCKKVDEPVPLSNAVDVAQQIGMESNKSKSSSRRWSVSSNGEDGAASLTELEERERIFKKVHTKLNALMEKEKSYELRLLVSRILALPMNCRDDLHGVVAYIYERAVNEPYLCILCARVCKVLTDIRMETFDFKRLLLGHCQRDFEKFTEVDPDAASVPAKKLKHVLLQEELKPPVRAIRNVRFFGELFNARVLSFHIMNVCIKRLSEEKDELLMTCLCVLLTTIGHKMDNLQLNLSKHVTEMNKLLNNGEGESECFRVLLQHVSELAENNWIRQTGSHLKTVDQIQTLAEQTILNLDTQPPSLQQDDRRLHEKNHSDDICDGASDASSPLPQLTSTENVAALLSAFQLKLTEELKYPKTCKMYKRVCQLLQKEESHRLIPIMTQIVALPIGDIHQLETIVDLIYEKAMDELDPFNCCAQLCKALSGIQVMGVDFRQLLLNRCQKEFRKSTRVEVKRGEIESVSDPERKNELQLELEEEEQRLRRRAVRNARFVGELFNLGIPSAKVIHKCMKQLLDKRDEVLFVRLCVLLTTVAHTMESQKQSVSKYVEKMKIVTTMWGEEPLHVLLHDVIVSWQHDWFTPDSDLKSVDQIQEMAEKIVSDMPFQLESVPTSSCQKPVSRSSPDTSCSDAYSTTERDGSDVSSSCPESVSSNAAAAWCEIRHGTWE